jgi:hypothetical protein
LHRLMSDVRYRQDIPSRFDSLPQAAATLQ